MSDYLPVDVYVHDTYLIFGPLEALALAVLGLVVVAGLTWLFMKNRRR